MAALTGNVVNCARISALQLAGVFSETWDDEFSSLRSLWTIFFLPFYSAFSSENISNSSIFPHCFKTLTVLCPPSPAFLRSRIPLWRMYSLKDELPGLGRAQGLRVWRTKEEQSWFCRKEHASNAGVGWQGNFFLVKTSVPTQTGPASTLRQKVLWILTLIQVVSVSLPHGMRSALIVFCNWLMLEATAWHKAMKGMERTRKELASPGHHVLGLRWGLCIIESSTGKERF